MIENHIQLKEQVSKLPDSPGVYKYLDYEQKIIYVGKAKNLKKRVSSYFNKNQQSYKTIKLVSQIANIDYVVVKTERDALLLENNLIKTLQPRYNINLKDDKTFPYICITRERFPRIFPIRRRIKELGSYYGPYTQVGDMRDTLELIQKLYTIRSCKLALSEAAVAGGKYKVCLEYHIHNCKGPCEGLQAEEDYLADIQQIHQILKGKISEVKEALKAKMFAEAQNLEFEKAQKTKESIDKLEVFRMKSQVVNEKFKDCEVYTIESDDKVAYLNFMKITEGRIIHSETKIVKKILEESDDEILSFFISYIRIETLSDADEVLSNIQVQDIMDLAIHVPERGDKRELIELSLRNIAEFKRNRTINFESEEKTVSPALERLQRDLNLKVLPTHIECFDNSNIQGTNPVAGMVCFLNGKPAKNQYRHFNIKTVTGPDDFTSMYEVVKRRYSRLKEEGKPFPQLILIDGGKGQLNAACQALIELEIYGQIAIASIAKRLEEIYVPGDEFPLHLEKKSLSLKLVQQIRDEVHRYSIAFHRNQRSKNANKTELQEIKGLGKSSIEDLYRHFKTLKKMKEASFEQLEEVIGTHRAQLFQNHYKQLG